MLMTAKDYLESLRERKINLYLFGEKVENYIDNPITRPSTNAVAMTYKLAHELKNKALATTDSSLTGKKINRFNSLFQSTDDMVSKVKLLRELGQRTACCFQRCGALDGINAVYSTTFEMEQETGTEYHQRFKEWLKNIQEKDLCM